LEKAVARTDRDYSGVRKIWERSIDWRYVASLVGSGNVLVSDSDLRVPRQSHAFIPEGWYIKSLGDKFHFGAPEQPEILREILASKNTGWVALPDEQLPLTLPEVDVYEPTDTGESPLAKIESWVKTTCPRCGGEARRETDTMPNWAGSSWYFLRYCDPKNAEALASKEALKYWMPVDLYNGGMEHTTLHLLYSRFWYKFLWDLGVVPEECGSEPYKMRRSHNMILGEGGVKMSKSKGNVVNPDDVVEKYGSDVFRVYEMFIGPYDQPAPWDTNGIEGVRRFLDKVWGLFEGRDMASSPQVTSDLETLFHQTLKKVTEGIDNLQFNTCISQLMILTNAIQDAGGMPEAMVEGYLKMLAPFAPHLADEIWCEVLGHKTSINARGAGWPAFDASKLQAATFELVVQVNGKVRDKITVASDISEDEAKATVLASEKVQKWLEGKTPKQVVYVKGRLVSVVV
jgi:leucyl-tRNA synthetase